MCVQGFISKPVELFAPLLNTDDPTNQNSRSPNDPFIPPSTCVQKCYICRKHVSGNCKTKLFFQAIRYLMSVAKVKTINYSCL